MAIESAIFHHWTYLEGKHLISDFQASDKRIQLISCTYIHNHKQKDIKNYSRFKLCLFYNTKRYQRRKWVVWLGLTQLGSLIQPNYPCLLKSISFSTASICSDTPQILSELSHPRQQIKTKTNTTAHTNMHLPLHYYISF